MKTWTLRFRLDLIVSFTLILAATVISAEFLYRAIVRRDLDLLERSVRADHAGVHTLIVEIRRLGHDTELLQPSLVDDASAWIRRKLGWASPLDYEGYKSDPWSHAYYRVAFSIKETEIAPTTCHVFIWSPRIGRFVHYMNWWGDCPRASCPWPRDPSPSPASTIYNSPPSIILK